MLCNLLHDRRVFLSTLSLRRATDSSELNSSWISYFYPRSPCGERHVRSNGPNFPSNFYPRSPCGERPRKSQGSRTRICISIHALLAESDPPQKGFSCLPIEISIHALLAESDRETLLFGCPFLRISIHALLAESDGLFFCRHATESRHFYPRSPCGERQKNARKAVFYLGFLSTLSLRRATQL